MSEEHFYFNTYEYESESKSRLSYDYKRYAAEGKNIPLKKNWSQSWCTLPAHYDATLNEVLKFELRPDDVIVSTFMKSGTTWMQECVWLLMNNLNFERAKRENVMLRSPYLE